MHGTRIGSRFLDAAMTTELALVRHGQTTFNRLGLYQGHADSPLTETGEAQARRLAPRLRALNCSPTIYCSDLGRARRTAELLADPAFHRIREDADLRERSYGVFEGLSRAEIARRYPDAWAASTSGEAHYAPPGGESSSQLVERIGTTFAKIAARHPDERVVVVTHGGVLTTFAKRVLGVPADAPRRFDIQNGSLSLFYLDSERGWMVSFLGDVAHLAGGQSASSAQ